MSDNRKFVIFDLDGTLIDSYECIIRCLNKTLQGYNESPLKDEELYSHTTLNQILLNLFSVRCLPFDMQSFKATFDEIHNNDFEDVQRIEVGICYLKRCLTNNLKILIITNKKQSIAHKIVKKLFPHLDCVIIGRRDTESLKSCPLLVKSRMAAMGFDLSNCDAYYGDSFEDLFLSKSLNVKYIQVN